MPAPAGRIITRSKAAHRRPSQHALDPATDPRGGFGLHLPNGLERLDDVRRTDVVDGEITEHGQRVLLNRGPPLPAVLCVLPAVFMRGEKLLEALAERHRPCSLGKT